MAAGEMINMEIEVLRLSHRLPRDERITTHIALVARAFGAEAVTYTGQQDSGLEFSVSRLAGEWGRRTVSGSEFRVSYEKSAASFIKAKKKDGFAIVHLTMYGIPINQKLPELKSRNRILVVVGSEQVPREIYELADFNISITNQPHSEVAALAIALDRLMEGKELEAGGFDFRGRLQVEPSEKGKKVKQI
jgi:tRNA (cytidine56-2'-O)-methyltransferase